MFALSVSISTSSSPVRTSSPSALSHFRIVPSSIESESLGMATSGMARQYRRLQRRGLGRCGRGVRDRELEARAATRIGLDPDAPTVALDDLAAHGQPDPVAAVLVARVQPLEHLEHALRVLRVDPDPV